MKVISQPSSHGFGVGRIGMRELRLCSLVGLGGVLILGLGVIMYFDSPHPREARWSGKLEQVLPSETEIPGWVITREELAATPELRNVVVRALNFDDAVHVSFRRGVERISLYIAYWKPGRMPHRSIAGHTPDICWVGNGWEVLDVSPHAAWVKNFPAEQRTMHQAGVIEHVVFWHLVGGRVHSYGKGKPPWHAMFGDLIERGFKQREEQVFVRISATSASLLEDNVVELIRGKIAGQFGPSKRLNEANR